MTSHRHSSITPELVDASSLPLDQFLFQDGKALRQDLEDAGAESSEEGTNRSRRTKRSTLRLLGRCGGLIAGLLVLLVASGAVVSFYFYPGLSASTDVFNNSALADAVDALLKLRVQASRTNQDVATAWAGVAGEASTACPPPAAVTETDNRIAALNAPAPWDGGSCLAKVREQLQMVESQQNGCELALNLMKTGKSVFSGFVPELADMGLASHSVFQARIAELELKRKSLLAKYVPESREVRAVEEEIAAVRESFRECLSAHVAYLNQRKEYLNARKAELEREFSAVSRKGGHGSHGPTAKDSVRERSRLAPAMLPRPEKPAHAPKAPTARLGDATKMTQYVP